MKVITYHWPIKPICSLHVTQGRGCLAHIMYGLTPSRNQVIKIESQVKSSHLPFKTRMKSNLLVNKTKASQGKSINIRNQAKQKAKTPFPSTTNV